MSTRKERAEQEKREELRARRVQRLDAWTDLDVSNSEAVGAAVEIRGALEELAER